MTMAGALSNALSGLTASSRGAEVVSSNIANALTEGYGRRELNLSSRVLGGTGAGVYVDGVSRIVDQVVISDRRLADASLGGSQTRADFMKKIEQVIGTPGTDGALSDRLAALDAAFVSAASRPDSETRLHNVVQSAQNLSNHINRVSHEIQSQRSQADQAIDRQVTFLNESLQHIRQLNLSILSQRSSGREVPALLDQRQQLVDQISSIVPVQEIPRDHGQIALVTTGGAMLLDGRAAEIGFQGVGVVTEDMTLAAGSLSGLTLNGTPIATTENGLLAGGSLAAQFEVRDELATAAQADLDALARDLVERFQNPAVDSTLGATSTGLFTDAGAFFDPANEAGLSTRLAINDRVNPQQGGAVWRLRDGIGAATPGDVGNAHLLQNMSQALTAARTPASGSFAGSAKSAARISSDFLSRISTAHQANETQLVFAQTKVNTLTAEEMRSGVDTDHEMQQLLLVEQSFAANARVMQTVDELLQTLMRI
ncbi:MAG: flagellar hook-associated protein FlgK [Rhodobacterales bacterium]|nr:MAG: flagellar hook-associated protein FlgK [Rhodobacterales bacterium]